MNNLLANIPLNLDKEVFEQLISSKHISIERIISKGHSSPKSGWYDQDKDEWVVVLNGKGILCFEDGSEFIMEPGDYLNIPAHSKHKVKWTVPDSETIWLAIHY